jgi:serine/threonine-protein kinase RsbT
MHAKNIVMSVNLPINNEYDIVTIRKLVRQWSIELKFSLIKQTKMMTAASEITRNALIYGGGGYMILNKLTNRLRQGLELIVNDEGCGIADIDLAMQDGYTTGTGLGMGLGGSKRLVDEFAINSTKHGTSIRLAIWK